MTRKLRSTMVLGLLVAACALGAETASGDGLPVPFDDSDNVGVANPGGGVRYATIGAGDRTIAVRTGIGTGEIQSTAALDGNWGVPLVAYDGTPSGLSGDGRTLALIKPRRTFPRESTSFSFLDTARMRVADRLTLRGDFSFDALSPDGRTMYLIEYPDPRDPTAYEVRAYDLARDRLLADPIVDPDEPQEEMAGFPQTRAVSSDGRWAYTLYARVGKEAPFIHALDTQRGAAVCIDLDELGANGQTWRYSLQPSPDGSTLAVTDRGSELASVDLDSFEVSRPAPVPVPDTTIDNGDGGLPWAVIGIAGGLVLITGSRILFARRRPRADDVELKDLVRDPERRPEQVSEEDREAECEPVR